MPFKPLIWLHMCFSLFSAVEDSLFGAGPTKQHPNRTTIRLNGHETWTDAEQAKWYNWETVLQKILISQFANSCSLYGPRPGGVQLRSLSKTICLRRGSWKRVVATSFRTAEFRGASRESEQSKVQLSLLSTGICCVSKDASRAILSNIWTTTAMRSRSKKKRMNGSHLASWTATRGRHQKENGGWMNMSEWMDEWSNSPPKSGKKTDIFSHQINIIECTTVSFGQWNPSAIEQKKKKISGKKNGKFQVDKWTRKLDCPSKQYLRANSFCRLRDVPSQAIHGTGNTQGGKIILTGTNKPLFFLIHFSFSFCLLTNLAINQINR